MKANSPKLINCNIPTGPKRYNQTACFSVKVKFCNIYKKLVIKIFYRKYFYILCHKNNT